MEHIRIICPHCNYSRGIPREKAPARPVTATCPRCKESFTFDPATAPTEPLLQVEVPLSPPASPKPPVREAPFAAGQPTPRHELRGIGELLVDAWGLFQRRFGVLFGVYLLSLLAIGFPLLAGIGVGVAVRDVSLAAAAVCMLLAFVGSTAGFCWGWGACVAASLDDALDIKAAYGRGKEKLVPFAFVTFLASFVICGGLLLFIVPGILFSVWFFFATFILFDDDTRGMTALLKSKAYVRGRWFEIFLRLVVIWACTAVLGAIPIVGPLVSLIAAPYVLVFHALLFKDLKEVAGQSEYPCGYGDKAKWIWIALIGYLLIPALIVATAGSAIYRQLAPLGSCGGASFSMPAPDQEAAIDSPSTAAGSRIGQGQPSAATFPSGAEVPSYPEDVHLFIYVVNCAGRLKANGAVVQEFGVTPDMQYNYNENGEKLVFGQNSLTLEYDPLPGPPATMQPRIHIRVSTGSGETRTILGEWEIEGSSPGQKSLDLTIPSP